MGNKKGQATILVGIIFQVVFIFFAMVINVGLLVNDKINLQNSVDIAAYYAAMKQAEVLNTMAHVNFQMRQAWKLLNWRLWALGDIGRFPQFINGDVSNTNDVQLDPLRRLNICSRNPFWAEEWKLANGRDSQNFCKTANFSIPAIKPLRLTGVQVLPIFGFMQVFRAQSERNARVFGSDCERGAGYNYFYATSILASYKIATANRKSVMRDLQKLLIESNDFKDIMGASVRGTTENVFKKNLTLANKESIESFEFFNSLNQKPFLVPVDVRVRMTYTDMFGAVNACKGEIKDIIDPPENKSNELVAKLMSLNNELARADYGTDTVKVSAQRFATTSKEDDFSRPTSTIGFEKNPWVLAYVKVKAKTKPKMLFSPIGNARITLTAESFAMPFGGRIGPWYKSNWASDQESSSGPDSDKIDKLLPPRVGEPMDGKGDSLYLPNYSRFPEDKLGMESELSRTQGFELLRFSNNEDRPKLLEDDYGNIIAGIQANQFKQDPLVFNSNPSNTKLRVAELIAVAPDLFDAAYYSIQKNFEEEFINNKSNGNLNKMFQIGVEDFGSNVSDKLQGRPQQNQKILLQAINIIKQKHARLFWKIKDPDHLNTGWTQEGADRYLPQGGTVSQLIAGPSNLDNRIGGRVGYSVKIVSESYLKKPLKLGGEKANAAPIKNPPP